jgi:glycosyltransferase involved in cell wall biosynthesis
VAISSDVQKRIKSIYGRDSKVIFPPVETQKFQPLESCGNFYLIVSRLASYKRIDLAIQAFNHLGLPLKIIGLGPYQGELKGMARPHIEFLGRLSDREVAHYYGACKALIFPGLEDFGLVPLEANAAGKPVIAFKGGGALDTIVEGVNGLFFTEPSVNSLVGAIQALENKRFYFQPPKIREHALKFDKEVFKDKFRKLFADLDIHQTIA